MASPTKDPVVVVLIMGREDSSLVAMYRQGIDDIRLLEGTQYVHKWLYGNRGDVDETVKR